MTFELVLTQMLFFKHLSHDTFLSDNVAKIQMPFKFILGNCIQINVTIRYLGVFH